jgi:hypothetical protein
MNVFYIILAACPILLLGAVAFFALIVVGVRRGDRGYLSPTHRNRIDRITRRVVGGVVRSDNDGSES